MVTSKASASPAYASNWETRVDFEGFTLPQHIGVCVNYGAHIWYQVQSTAERELATQLGIALDIVDADMDAVRQAAQVEQFIEQGVDVLIFSAADPSSAPKLLKRVHEAHIPVVTESLWIESPAVTTKVMINDFIGGQKLGRAAAGWVRSRMGGRAKVLDVTVPRLDDGVRRSDGFLAGLRESLPGTESFRVDGRAAIAASADAAAEVLRCDPTYNVIFGVDDESAIGARTAYEQLDIALDDVLICSFGFSGPQAYDWLESGIYQIVCAMFPEYQARMLIHAAIYAHNNSWLPRHLVGPSTVMTAETLRQYYVRTPDGVHLNVDAVRKVSTVGEERI